MNGEEVTTVEDGHSQESGARERQRSTIQFPYIGLKEAVEVARAIYNNVGAGECEDDQLASWLSLSPKSSGFRTRLSAARLFGVIETISSGTYKLPPLGIEIVDSDRTDNAKITAFLNVPLFEEVFNRWRGGQIPPTAGLEREIVGLGVAEKQKERARQVLERSAEYAGFFEQGKDRLVKPGFAPVSDPPQGDNNFGGDGGKGGGGNETPELDPVIKGLIDKLPAPSSVWAEAERDLWLEILKSSFKLVYKEEVVRLPSPDSLKREQKEARIVNESTPED